jgi:hypothetical protein
MHCFNLSSRKQQNPETLATQEQMFMFPMWQCRLSEDSDVAKFVIPLCDEEQPYSKAFYLLAVWQEEKEETIRVSDLSPMTERESNCDSAVRQSHPQNSLIGLGTVNAACQSRVTFAFYSMSL